VDQNVCVVVNDDGLVVGILDENDLGACIAKFARG
jgi:hypothetical protein